MAEACNSLHSISKECEWRNGHSERMLAEQRCAPALPLPDIPKVLHPAERLCACRTWASHCLTEQPELLQPGKAAGPQDSSLCCELPSESRARHSLQRNVLGLHQAARAIFVRTGAQAAIRVQQAYSPDLAGAPVPLSSAHASPQMMCVWSATTHPSMLVLGRGCRVCPEQSIRWGTGKKGCGARTAIKSGRFDVWPEARDLHSSLHRRGSIQLSTPCQLQAFCRQSHASRPAGCKGHARPYGLIQ